jgi:Zn-dependent M28 family amino/carboxypeptidase
MESMSRSHLSNPRSLALADPARLEARVRRLVGDYFPRDIVHPDNLSRAADSIAEELKHADARVADQPFAVEGRDYRNVIGTFGPQKGEVVIVGAHYDAAGEMPGADDNASGVAGLLELADLLSDVKLARRVELVAYSLEETPYATGSTVHAQSLSKAGVSVKGMICLEMIGCFLDKPGSQHLPWFLRPYYPDRGNFIAVVGNSASRQLVRQVARSMSGGTLPVQSIAAPRWLIPDVGLSDHSSYWQEGFPAVMVTDTAFHRNWRYHTADDLPDTLDYQRMAGVVSGVFEAVIDIANNVGLAL